MTDLLRIENLSISLAFSVPEKKLLHGVSLSLLEGQILALAGNSGAGKSLLCHAILGLEHFYAQSFNISGQIIYDNKNILMASPSEKLTLYRHHFAFLPQDPFSVFDPLQSVGKHIQQVLFYCRGFNASQALALMQDHLSMMGLTDRLEILHQRPCDLSRGMLQRLALALCLAKNPTVLIADEPTSALDTLSQDQVLAYLTQARRSGISCLLITHHLGVTARCAQRIAVMDCGEVCEEQTITDFFAAPHHAKSRELLANTGQLYNEH